MPETVDGIFATRTEASILWSIKLGAAVTMPSDSCPQESHTSAARGIALAVGNAVATVAASVVIVVAVLLIAFSINCAGSDGVGAC